MLRNLATGLVLTACVARAAMASDTAAPASDADPWILCARATATLEQSARIPNDLLTAMSLVESGRWRSDQGRSLAWPWTINARGTTQRYATRDQAIAAVEALRARGVRSIDVGCMQVNLRYHPDAFPDLETAFDPTANARYAVDYLKRLRDRHGSWQRAVGAYHSETPVYNTAYRQRVRKALHRIRETRVIERRRARRTAGIDQEAAGAAPQQRPVGWLARGRTPAPRGQRGGAVAVRGGFDHAGLRQGLDLAPPTPRELANARFPRKTTARPGAGVAAVAPKAARRGLGLEAYRQGRVRPPGRLVDHAGLTLLGAPRKPARRPPPSGPAGG